jgi:DNA-binding winged helix-turn-helix (wHTH) protein/tetratricopeptide (TPR) repeat protein
MKTEGPIIFPPFQLDAANQRLARGEQIITLRPKAFAVLVYLVCRPDQLVSKEELLEACWPNTAVSDTVLKVCVREIREALDDNPKAPQFIETAHRRGYRFVGRIAHEPTSDFHPSDSTISLLRSSNEDFNQPSVSAVKKQKLRDSGRHVLHTTLPLPAQPAAELVGREPSLERLRASLKQARAGRRQVVFITGEAGIGKTSLVEVFVQEATSDPSIWAARGQCLEQYGSGEAYLPVLEAISRLCQDRGKPKLIELLGRQAPTWLQQLPWLLQDSDVESLQRSVIGATRERMLREMSEFLEALTAATPLMLVLEDLHWGDYSTLDLVSYLARQRNPARLLIIATYRPVDVALSEHPLRDVKLDLQAHRLCDEIALEYLGPEAVDNYLNVRFARHKLPREFASLIHQRTDGNPFFLVNAVDFLQNEGLIAESDSEWSLAVPIGELEMGVPDSVRQMIEKQIDKTDRENQRVLEAAAVAGVEFSASAVAAGLEQPISQIEEHLEQLARQHLFLRATGMSHYPDGTVTERYSFIHALYQEVLYQRVSGGRRSRLHQLIGVRGEQLYGEHAEEVAGELAMHFEQGRDDKRAVKYLRHSAKNHLVRFANREAVAYLGRALALVEGWPENERNEAHMSILEQAGLARRAMGDMGEAAANFEALSEYASQQGRREEEVKALAHLATALSWIDRDRCLDAARRSLDLSRDVQDDLLQAHISGCWGYWHVLFLGWGDDHLESLAMAVGAARAANDDEALGLHLARYSFLECLQSDYGAAVRSAEEGAQLGLQTSDAHTYMLSQYFEAWALLHVGRWGEMRRILDHGLEMAQRNQHTRWTVLFLVELSWLHEQCFDFEVALQMSRQALEQAAAINHPYTEALSLILCAFAHLGLEQHEDAFRCLQRVSDRLDSERILMDWVLRLLLHHALSRYHLSQGDLSKAREEAKRVYQLAMPSAERTYLALAELTIAEIELRDQHQQAAEMALARSLAIVEDGDAPLAEWRARVAAAVLAQLGGRFDDAAKHRRRAQDLLHRLADSLDQSDSLRRSLLESRVMEGLSKNGASESNPLQAGM